MPFRSKLFYKSTIHTFLQRDQGEYRLLPTIDFASGAFIHWYGDHLLLSDARDVCAFEDRHVTRAARDHDWGGGQLVARDERMRTDALVHVVVHDRFELGLGHVGQFGHFLWHGADRTHVQVEELPLGGIDQPHLVTQLRHENLVAKYKTKIFHLDKFNLTNFICSYGKLDGIELSLVYG